MNLKLKKLVYNFDPSAAQLLVVGPTVFVVMGVKRGTQVLFVAVRIGTLFNGTGMSIVVGDDVAGGGDIDGFVAAGDVTEGTAGLYPGYGAYFSGARGRLYTGDDTVDISYTGSGDTTTGAASVIVVYTEIE